MYVSGCISYTLGDNLFDDVDCVKKFIHHQLNVSGLYEV